MKKIIITIVILLIVNQGFNQVNNQFSNKNRNYKNLVFAGGGMMGLVYCGALTEIEKLNILQNIKNVAGTSAGAITAALIAVGYNAEEITNLIYETDFNKFNDGSNMFFDGVFRFSKKYGYYKGSKFEQWLKDKISAKTGNPNITFEQLHQNGFKDLYIVGTNLTKQKSIIFSVNSYPNMKISDAVRVSMSVPLYYEPCYIDSLGNLYNVQNDTFLLDLFVDGGLLNNYPIDIFDSMVQTEHGLKRIPNKETLGFLIDSELQCQYDREGKGLAPREIKDIQDYSEAVFLLVYESLLRRKLTNDDFDRTVFISNKGIGPKITKLNESQKNSLIESGQYATKYFFSK